ncbi:MAG: formylglycine-generating enzyme family protein [Lentisphaerae bacterium]|nr:formylglycine-generating enzyme family protein [Lentisphaerota bacterium]
MKKTLVLLGLALAVTLGFCGCGNEKSEEEIYEQLVRVEEKAKKIEDARLSIDQGFQEKWDLLKRKQAIANRAFSQSDYNATSKFLQEAEAAADWIMNCAEADEQYSVLQSRKRESNGTYAPKYASTIYAEAEKYEQQGQEAYEKSEFEEATRLYVLAANEYKKATSTASAFRAAVRVTNAAKEKADMVNASRWASAIHQEALSCLQRAVSANAQEKYDEALQSLDAAEGTFEKAEKEALRNALSHLIKSFIKIEEKDCYIGKYEVTQAQWKAVMGNNPAYFKGADRPVEMVSWNDAMEFCKRLNDAGLAPAGYKFSLPTEAQWEFAARGGNKSKGYEYSGSNDINEVAWHDGNSDNITHHDVGTKKPNELGLYDMSGNVMEWCLDTDGSYRVLRGGSWNLNAISCLVAFRCRNDPDYRRDFSGFRLALVPVQ